MKDKNYDAHLCEFFLSLFNKNYKILAVPLGLILLTPISFISYGPS